MTSKKNIKLITEILNIEGVRVISYQQYKGIGIILQIESTNKESICPRCRTESHRLHQNHRYIIKDLPLGEQQVFLEINKRQFKCDKCKKPFSEHLDFVSPRRGYTKRLGKKVIQEVLDSNVHSVAKKGVVTSEEIKRMLKDASNNLLFAKSSSLKRLGIDEIALVKGKGNYCAVLIDLDKSKLLAILPGRTQEQIKKILNSWGEEVLRQIEEASTDLWQGYKKFVNELMPRELFTYHAIFYFISY